ncbi:unnamed protein product [Choristocarpus tenellus]
MLVNNGTRWRKSPPRTPQSNGIAERAIKQLMGAARSQLVKAGLGDKEYWFFAITDVAFKTGGMPHEYLGRETPCERLTGKSFNYDRLRAWGSECYVHQDKQQRGASAEFHPCAKRGKIMGHDRTSLCWHIWLPQEAKLVTSAQVTFEPDKHIMERKTMTSTDDLRPSTIAEALAGHVAEHWKKAMEQEKEGQQTKGTFREGESLPPGRRPVKTRFIFKIKRTAHGDIERYKASLVARDFSQQEGVDYFTRLVQWWDLT